MPVFILTCVECGMSILQMSLSDHRPRYFGSSRCAPLASILQQLCPMFPGRFCRENRLCVPLFCFILPRETKADPIPSGERCLCYCFPGYFEEWLPLGFFLCWLFDLFASYSDSLD